MISFEVIGIPKPQGSMKAFNAGGHAHMKPSGGAAFASWRNAVAQAARDVAESDDVDAPFDGALGLSVDFLFPMPSSAKAAERRHGRRWKTTAPDTDKLLRTIGDAMTAAGLVRDDARFVAIIATKVETTGWTGAVIRITREDGTP